MGSRIGALLAVLSIAVAASSALADVERVGLLHNPRYSPDGEYLVFSAEHRYGKQSAYTLTVFANKQYGRFGTVYSLTPEIVESVLSPDGTIVAYIAKDFTSWAGVYLYRVEHATAYGLAWMTNRIDIAQLQFAHDQMHLRFRQRSRLEPGAGGWAYLTLEGEELFDGHPAAPKGPWAPATAVPSPPGFLTQEYPKIEEADPDMQWSSEPGILFLRNAKGVWRCDVRTAFQPQWALLVEDADVVEFDVSPDGAKLLYQTVLPGEAEVHRITLYDSDSAARVEIGMGWDAVFSAEGDAVFFSDLDALHEYTLEGVKVRRWAPTSFMNR